MFRKIILFSFFLLDILLLYSQGLKPPENYHVIYRRAEKLYASENSTDLTDSVALVSYLAVIASLEKHPDDVAILFDSYVKAGILEISKKEDQKALTFLLTAIPLQKKYKLLSDSLLFRPFLFAGNAYYDLNNLDSALYCYRQAEALINRYPAISESERLYNKSGALYYETGDYKKSIQYFSKALSMVESHQPANIYFIVNYKNNIASALRKLQRYDEAMALYQSLLPYNINRNELLHNIGVTYLNAGKYREAINQLKKIKYSNQAKLNDIGYAYLQLKQYDSAGYFLQTALKSFTITKSNQKNLDYGISLKYMGDLEMVRQHPKLAIEFYQKSIVQIDPSFNDTVIQHNPDIFQGLHNSFFLFGVLTAKAAAFHAVYLLRQDPAVLNNAYTTYSAAIKLAQHAERTYNSDEAKLFLSNNVDTAYKQVVAIGLLLYGYSNNKIYLNEAFSYAENSKASVLQSGLHQLSLESIEGLPQDLISQEKNLKVALARLNIQLSGSTDSSVNVIVQKKILDNEIRLSALQEKMDENPKYYQLKFDSRDISMNTIREKILKDNTAILSYYYLEDKLICFYITKEKYGYATTSINDSLRQNILLLRKALSQPESHDKTIIPKTCKWLFQQLVRPVHDKILGKKHLVIIPHNEISYIPFEVLTDPVTNELLLSKFAISYNYSANFFADEQQPASQHYQVLALAPFAEPGFSQSLPILKASLSEIANLKGKILLDSQATKQHFIQFLPEYPIIHLATHAVVNDPDPLQSFIEFFAFPRSADTLHRLYEQEIYQLDMKSSKLVVLSACETGNGQLINGEGVMSLSRAFSYAGCKSVITSLWQADDVATAFIGNRLHNYLQKGFGKDEALQLAKLDYLKSDAIEPGHKTPAYWAHLILIGDAAAIEKKGTLAFWVVGALTCFMALIIILKKRTRPS